MSDTNPSRPERGGLVNPASDPPAWRGTTGSDQHQQGLHLGETILAAIDSADGLIPAGEQIGGFVDEAGEPVPTAPILLTGCLVAPAEPVYNALTFVRADTDYFVNGVRATPEAVPGAPGQVRLRATLGGVAPQDAAQGIYGPNPGDEHRPAPRPAIDRSMALAMALADCTTEELLAEINGRVAAMQRQWQDSLDLAARYAQIAQIVGGK